MTGDNAPKYHKVDGVGSMEDIRHKVFQAWSA
jgi:hypothetical protein